MTNISAWCIEENNSELSENINEQPRDDIINDLNSKTSS